LVFLDMELLVAGIDAAAMVMDIEAVAARVLRKDRGRRAAHDVTGLLQHRRPARRIERRVIDVADERRNLLDVWHGKLPQAARPGGLKAAISRARLLEIRLKASNSMRSTWLSAPKTHVLSHQGCVWFKAGEKIF